MSADPARSCYNSAWWTGLFPVGAAATAAYGFGLPGAVVWLLSARRSEMDELSFVLRYGFLVGRFVRGAWWFEAAIMGRKLGVVLCMTFAGNDKSKASLGVVALLGALFHLAWVRPYGRQMHNGLAAGMLGATALVLFGGVNDAHSYVRVVCVVVGVGAIVVGIVAGNAADLWLLARAEAAVEKTEFAVAGAYTDTGEFESDHGSAVSMDNSVALTVFGDSQHASQAGTGYVGFSSSEFA